MEIGGKTLLEYQLNRLKRAACIDQIVVATTYSPADDAVESEALRLGVKVFRGSNENVLERFYMAAKKFKGKTIIRITADCPLIDPEIVDQTIEAYCESTPSVDYLSNCLFRTYPRGMDTEVFSFKALEDAYLHHTDFFEQEHVTPYMYNHPEKFRLGQIRDVKDNHKIRLTVDTLEDFVFVKAVIEALSDTEMSLETILKYLEKNPELLKINEHVQQKA
jgi:spore coat polysaccharide biosynthesis protein SpsF